MNDLIKRETPPPVEITEYIQVSLNRLGRELETHAESGIRIGKELIHLKEITPHGQYRELVKWSYGLKDTMITNYMNVARKFGENASQLTFSNQVLIELSQPAVPESAREQAAELDSLTVKQAKELVDAHKRIADLESGRSADLSRLIPGLSKKYKGASITIGMANRLSVLDEEQQQIFLEMIESKLWEEKKNRTLADEKLRALEDLAKTTRERDEVKLQLEKLSDSDTATILMEKEKELKKIRVEYSKKLAENMEQAEQQAIEMQEKKLKGQILAAEAAVKKAQKERNAAVKGRGSANRQVDDLEREIKRLNMQLEVDNPVNVDNARVRHIEDAGRGLIICLNELRKDMDRLGGGMENSISTAADVIKKASLELAKLQGMQDSIINIE